MDIKVFDTAAEASHFVAMMILTQVKDVGTLNLGLATGRTMNSIYHHLVSESVKQKIDYSKVKGFAVDEYIGLEADSEFLYEFYLKLHLFNQLNFKEENLFIPNVNTEDLDNSCLEYEKVIEAAGGLDLQILGVGMNGHIGLNEPGASLDSRTRVVGLTSSTRKSNKVLFGDSEVPKTALSMGVGTILDAKSCVLVATGDTKAEIIERVVNGETNSKVPASAIKLHKNSLLVLDKKAAKLI